MARRTGSTIESMVLETSGGFVPGNTSAVLAFDQVYEREVAGCSVVVIGRHCNMYIFPDCFAHSTSTAQENSFSNWITNCAMLRISVSSIFCFFWCFLLIVFQTVFPFAKQCKAFC